MLCLSMGVVALGQQSRTLPQARMPVAESAALTTGWKMLAEGDPEAARDVFQRIVEGTSWAAFGYIAAEADLASMPPLE